MLFFGSMTLDEFLRTTGETQADFAARIGVTKEAVRLWANGSRVPRRAQMVAITEATQSAVTANDFVGPLAGAAQSRSSDAPAGRAA